MDHSLKRSANWNDDQVEVLMRLYTENILSLDGKFSASVSNDLKRQKWAEIADKVSALGPIRDSKQCQKKASDTKSTAKGKAARIHQSDHQTGGGNRSKERLSQLEELVVSKIPDVAYKGIPGGIDSSNRSQYKQPMISPNVNEENYQYLELPDVEFSPYEPPLKLTFRNVRSECPNVSICHSPSNEQRPATGFNCFTSSLSTLGPSTFSTSSSRASTSATNATAPPASAPSASATAPSASENAALSAPQENAISATGMVSGEPGQKRKRGGRNILPAKNEKNAREELHKTYMDNVVILGQEMANTAKQLVEAGREMTSKLDQNFQTQIRIANSLERLEKHFTSSIYLDPSEP